MTGPQPGATIAGRYRLERVIGTGAMGTVWRASHLELDREVAIKLMHPQFAAREESRARFAREARVAATLDHPSSVAVLDFGEADGTLFLVMELLAGEPLRARLGRGALPHAHAITIARQVAAVLAAAHRIRLVHRDIKPENIFLAATDDELRATVVDFGLAFIADPEPGSPFALGRMTQDGNLAGTPAYMAPEQVRGAAIGPACDVYALGCVVYEMFAGRPPFVGAVGEVITRHAYAPVVPLRQLELAAPPPVEVDALVLAMLAKSPPARPSAGRLVAALARLEDPDPDARRGRSSPRAVDRAARALGRAARPATADVAPLEVGVLAAPDEELALALATAGLRAVSWDTAAARPPVVWAPGLATAALVELTSAGAAVVTDVAPADAARIPALIRAGVVDAVVVPAAADDIARKLRRAAQLARPKAAP